MNGGIMSPLRPQGVGLLISSLCLLFFAFLSGCRSERKSESAAPPARAVPLFADVTARSGIRFTLHGKRSPQNILETLGHGVALGDFEGDGCLDIILLGPDQVRLYKNLGGYHFQDITAASGLRQAGDWAGIAVGDYDNDGRPDLYVCGYDCSALYHNEGGGRFREVTRAAGLGVKPPGPGGTGDWRTSAGFADLDGDGRLDLYVCRYIQFGPASPQFCTNHGQRTACSPEIYAPQRGLLYHNLGGGRFAEATAASGLAGATGCALGVAFGDYRGDGRAAIALANDEKQADLFENRGDLRFVNVSREGGTAYSASGHNLAGMGIDWGDYNRDGRPDLFMTTFEDEAKSLYQNLGGGQFSEVGAQAGLNGGLDALVSFGCKFFDYDNDGWLDLIVTSGDVNDNTEIVRPGTHYAQPIFLFHNQRGTFTDATERLDPQARRSFVGRGLATGDLTNSGRCDVVISNMEGSPVLLQNRSDGANHWITLRLIGRQSNRDGFGARLTLRAGGHSQVVTATNSGSFLSASDPRPHFGLGPARTVDSLEVRWPSGRRDVLANLAADRFYTVVEAKGLAAGMGAPPTGRAAR